MNNPAIEQALFELHESLKQIKSANENVNNISQKSEHLITHMNKVIATLNAISANVNIDKEAINNQLTENNKTLQMGIAKLLNDANGKYSEIQNQLLNNQLEFSRELVKITKNIQDQLNKELENYKTAIRLTLTSMEKEVGIFSNQINTVKESILKVETSLIELQNRVDETDFKSEFERLNKTMSFKVNILLLINILILMGISAAIFIRWVK
jgi:hypothetical protein